MSMASVTDVTGSAAASAGASTPKARNQLGNNDFMQLLVTQLRYQDPLKPMDDRDFMAQVAQFSTLEQMTEMTRWSQMTYGLGLVGQEVSFQGPDGQARSGIVRAVKLVDGVPSLNLGDQDLKIDQVLSVSHP
jgi:flagellar basal-body rod modification protein FlgD